MLKWLLGVPPKVGSVWIHGERSLNPFKDQQLFRIVDVKSGYVKYDGGDIWSRGSDTIRDFRMFYREIPDPNYYDD